MTLEKVQGVEAHVLAAWPTKRCPKNKLCDLLKSAWAFKEIYFVTLLKLDTEYFNNTLHIFHLAAIDFSLFDGIRANYCTNIPHVSESCSVACS